ncbi:MAG: hypothetical protein LBD94_03320 [Rickettsiales bacterium]|jgi:hypothetical protein|nr:hypothetical protein [Rickettsiales bacterium]
MNKIPIFLLAALALRVGAAAYVSPGATIDNVQNYSSSPYYSPDGPYDKRFPTPVYAKGPSLGAAECQHAVDSAIWTQCSFRNNCADSVLSDIRPGVMLELSNRTDNNYTAACTGYIDSAFQKYKRQMTGAVVSTGFPTATRPVNYNQSQQTANSLTYYDLLPQHELEQKIREGQLQNLQRQTGGLPHLTAESMPATFRDLSFTERMEYLREGWQDPAVDKLSYQQLKVESDKEMFNRQTEEAEAQKNAQVERNELLKLKDPKAWCEEHLGDCKKTEKELYCLHNPNDEDCGMELEKKRLELDRQRLANQQMQERIDAQTGAANGGNASQSNNTSSGRVGGSSSGGLVLEF